MKHLSIFTAAIFFTINCFGQPALNTENGFTVGTVVNLFVDTSPVLNEGNSGAGETWNFSSLSDNDSAAEFIGMLKVNTPYAADFPQATLAVKSVDFTGSPIYNYFENNASVYQTFGYENSSSNIIYSNPLDIMHYPFTYQDQFTDSYSGVTGDNGVNYGVVEELADGYGSIQLPSGTFSDCLRVREVRRDSLITPIFGEAYTNDTSYKFYVAGYPEPVCQVNYHHVLLSGYPFDFTEIYWQEIQATGVIENSLLNKIEVFPNPCTDFIILKIMDEKFPSSVQVKNNLGIALTVPANKSGKAWMLNVADLKDGCYYIEFTEKNERRILPFIKMN